MTPSQLIPSTYLFLMSVVQFYDETKAEEHKYKNLQSCIDRLESIAKADITEHARLLIIDRRIFQALLPHMGASGVCKA